jgi:hypothetical protein
MIQASCRGPACSITGLMIRDDVGPWYVQVTPELAPLIPPPGRYSLPKGWLEAGGKPFHSAACRDAATEGAGAAHIPEVDQ